MLRITSGIAKNKKIEVPNIPNIRAVQEVTKLAIFAILGERIKDSACLDLYAGSGNLGIEALSRGAKSCDFVDNHKLAQKAVLKNLQKCNLMDQSEVFCEDVVKHVTNTSNKYDVIFIDPFYKDTSHKFLLKNVEEILNSNGLVFFLHGKNLDIQNLVQDINLEVSDQRRYGKNHLSILCKSQFDKDI